MRTSRMQPATPEQIFMMTLMGQALLNIQVLEDTLSRSITLKADVKHPGKLSRAEVDELLRKRQKLSLGQAIGVAKHQNLYDVGLLKELGAFLKNRNWFIHSSIDDFYTPHKRTLLIRKLKTFAYEAHTLQRQIEDDLISYSESCGIDMSAVRDTLKEF